MISVVSIYDDVRFIVNKENGFVPRESFNNASWLAQLRLIDWLSGGPSGAEAPELESTQKNRDWLSIFIKKYTAAVSNGKVTKPSDLYLLDNIFKINKKVELDEGEVNKPNKPVDVLSGDKFTERLNTFIDELKPSNEAPIAKVVEASIEFEPTDIGNVTVEYIRYPKRSELKTTEDNVYNDEVPDPVTSENFEWGEYARPLLVKFIVDEIANHTREQALKQFNSLEPEVGNPRR